MVYLDHNASTPVDERVVEAMLPYMREHYANPSSVHGPGRKARDAIERAREQVAELAGVHPSRVVFTSGGSEANNAALKGVAARMGPASMAISRIEHASVLHPARTLTRHGWRIEPVGVDGEGRVTRDALEAACSGETRLVSVMWANNETGVVQDVAGVAAFCAERGYLFHCDAVQAAGKVAIDAVPDPIHLLTLSAHKLYGPKGVGALIVDKGVDLEPLVDGGGQERGRRGGTENLAGVVGFGVAAELARRELAARSAYCRGLMDRLEGGLKRLLPQAVSFGAGAERLDNTLFFAVPGVEGQTLIMALDQAGFAVSSGAACGEEHHEPSHVLGAMGVESALAHGAVRVSLGMQNTEESVDGFLRHLTQQVGRLQRFAAATAW